MTERWILTLLIVLTSSCTVVNIVGESGDIKTKLLPGIAYIHIAANEKPLYIHSETWGAGLSNKSITLGYGLFEQIIVQGELGKSCLLISVSDGLVKRDFSFQKKDPEYVCREPEAKGQ